MKRYALIRKFDPRLAADLNRQRSSIVKGLLCVLAAALISTVTILLIKWSVSAISDAAPRKAAKAIADKEARKKIASRSEDLAEKLGAPKKQIADVLLAVEPISSTAGTRVEEDALVQRLNLDRQKVHDVLAGQSNKESGDVGAVNRLGFVCIIVILLFVGKYWFTRGQTYYLSRAAARLSSEMRMRLFRKLQSLPVTYFNDKRAGAIQSVLTNDVNVYQSAVSVVRDSIDGPIRALGALITIFVMQPYLAIVALLFLPPMTLAIRRNAKRMKNAQATVQDDLSNLNAMSTESLLGTRVIKAFAAESRVAGRFDTLVGRSYESQMEATRRQASLKPLVELIGAAALATILYICGWMSYLGRLDIGDIAALVYALDVVNQGFRSWGNVTNTFSQVQAASDRIYREVLDQPEPPESLGGKTILAPTGKIEFQNVTFRYPDGTEALNNVSFTLEPGSSLALVGPSGAGKSTIADLILRFYEPSEGRILFDGIDLSELDTTWLRGQIGVVPQQTFLFAGTIAENIRMGMPDADQRDIDEASKAAHVDEFVSALPLAYEATIGEGGAGLSGGQRQRLAIARALVRKPPLLLLDEATSALDATSEKVVTEALEEVMKQRTTLFIAHRLTTAARADRILVLSKGQVVEVGSHTELMEANGAYAGLFRAFSGGVLG